MKKKENKKIDLVLDQASKYIIAFCNVIELALEQSNSYQVAILSGIIKAGILVTKDIDNNPNKAQIYREAIQKLNDNFVLVLEDGFPNVSTNEGLTLKELNAMFNEAIKRV